MKSKNKPLPGAHWYSYLFLYGLLKPAMFLYFHLFQDVHFRTNGYKVPKGPVFFIGNHHTNWDGFYHCVMFYWRFPHYIVHDEAFKNDKYANFFGDFLGQVPRARVNGDLEPVMELKRIARSGRSVNVYPEGDIHMFGRTLEVDDGIAKMARLINLPIVLTRVKGAHLRAPRWSRLAHHTHIEYEISDVISIEESKSLSPSELAKRIIDGITVSAYGDQIAKPRPVWGQHRAEWLELGLYQCPRCQSFESFVSNGNDMVCQCCGLTVHVNKYLLLETDVAGLSNRPDVWDDAQEENLIRKLRTSKPGEHIFSLVGGCYQSVAIDDFFSKESKPADARLYADRIEIHPAGCEQVTINISDVFEANLQYKDVLEIITKTNRYRLWRPYPKWSAYLWVKSVKTLTRYDIIEAKI